MSSFFELFYLNNLVTNGDCSLLLTTDTEVTPTTIIGTNCQQYQLPESKWQREQLEEAIRKQKSKIKKKTNL